MRILNIENPNTLEHREYLELLKDLKREQNQKDLLPQVIFKNLTRKVG